MDWRQNSYAAKAMESPEFYEELLLLKAQELISRLMEEQNVSKSELAQKLGKSKAHITNLLADGRNLTLKTLANVCYSLGAEVELEYQTFQTNNSNYNQTDDEMVAPYGAAFSALRNTSAYLH